MPDEDKAEAVYVIFLMVSVLEGNMESRKIYDICLILVNRGVHKLKEEIEYLNADNTLDVYSTVDAILVDAAGRDCPPEKLQFFYDKLFEFYGKKNKAADAKMAA